MWWLWLLASGGDAGVPAAGGATAAHRAAAAAARSLQVTELAEEVCDSRAWSPMRAAASSCDATLRYASSPSRYGPVHTHRKRARNRSVSCGENVRASVGHALLRNSAFCLVDQPFSLLNMHHTKGWCRNLNACTLADFCPLHRWCSFVKCHKGVSEKAQQTILWETVENLSFHCLREAPLSTCTFQVWRDLLDRD